MPEKTTEVSVVKRMSTELVGARSVFPVGELVVVEFTRVLSKNILSSEVEKPAYMRNRS